jgi:hypothetical protein
VVEFFFGAEQVDGFPELARAFIVLLVIVVPELDRILGLGSVGGGVFPFGLGFVGSRGRLDDRFVVVGAAGGFLLRFEAGE